MRFSFFGSLVLAAYTAQQNQAIVLTQTASNYNDIDEVALTQMLAEKDWTREEYDMMAQTMSEAERRGFFRRAFSRIGNAANKIGRGVTNGIKVANKIGRGVTKGVKAAKKFGRGVIKGVKAVGGRMKRAVKKVGRGLKHVNHKVRKVFHHGRRPHFSKRHHHKKHHYHQSSNTDHHGHAVNTHSSHRIHHDQPSYSPQTEPDWQHGNRPHFQNHNQHQAPSITAHHDPPVSESYSPQPVENLPQKVQQQTYSVEQQAQQVQQSTQLQQPPDQSLQEILDNAMGSRPKTKIKQQDSLQCSSDPLAMKLAREKKRKHRAIRRVEKKRIRAEKRVAERKKRLEERKEIEQKSIAKERERFYAVTNGMKALINGSMSPNPANLTKPDNLQKLAASNPYLAKAMSNAWNDPNANQNAKTMHGLGKIIQDKQGKAYVSTVFGPLPIEVPPPQISSPKT